MTILEYQERATLKVKKMVTTVEVKKLYEEGRSSEALEKITASYPTLDTMPVEIMEVKAWCYFRREEYVEATETALAAAEKGSINGQELLAQLAGYVSKDDELLKKIHQKFPNSPSVWNALAIRARDGDSIIPAQLIVEAALRFINNENIGAINLINNTARLLLAKGNGGSDTITAIGFWQIALMNYGDKNYHHRAAVYFWLSNAYENIGEMSSAIQSATNSLILWDRQVIFDPDNPKFKKNLAGAEERLEELKRKSATKK
jgi:hypothetical protein